MLLQHLVIDAGPSVEALHVPDRGETDEVAVSLLVRREQDEMRVLRGRVRWLDSHATVSVRHVGLAPYDRSDPGLAGLLLEGPRSEQVAVVRESDGRHPEVDGAVDQIVDPVRAVEERVLAMRVEMNERH